MLNDALFALWFFLPAGVANVTPVFVAEWGIFPKWAIPLDRGYLVAGKRLFGYNKTVRGILIGVFAGIIAAYLQVFFYGKSLFIQEFSPIDYSNINPFIFGLLISAGALGGDLVKSFFKRQIGIPSGKAWFPFDQLDYIIGGVVASMLYVQLSLTQYILIVITWFLIHLISTTIGYLANFKKSPL